MREKLLDGLTSGYYAVREVDGTFIVFNAKLKDILTICSRERFNIEEFIFSTDTMKFVVYRMDEDGKHHIFDTTDCRKFIPKTLYRTLLSEYNEYMEKRRSNWKDSEYSFDDLLDYVLDETRISGMHAWYVRQSLHEQFNEEMK